VWIRPALLLALAVAPGVRGAAAAPEPSGLAQLEPGFPEPSVEPAEEEPTGDRRGGWRHAVGLGAQSITFSSKEESRFTFYSGSLGYLGSVGATGGFLHAFLLVPFQARQDGAVYDTASYYRQRLGADLLLGAEHRWAIGPGLELEAGPGLHATFLWLPAKVGYRDFSASPLGLGAGGVLRWATRDELLHRTVTIDVYASVAYDFVDPLHANDLTHGLAFRAGVGVGLGARR
jgi:hypothetical protein